MGVTLVTCCRTQAAFIEEEQGTVRTCVLEAFAAAGAWLLKHSTAPDDVRVVG